MKTGADVGWTGPNEVRVDTAGVSKTELDPDLCGRIKFMNVAGQLRLHESELPL